MMVIITKMILCLLVFTGTYQIATGFKTSHYYPCSWVGKTFKISSGNDTVGSWEFDITGKGSMLDTPPDVLQLECVKIEGQFIILRKIGTDMTTCMSIYNITADVFKLYYGQKYVYKTKEMLDIQHSLCDICRNFVPYIARVNGYADDLLTLVPNCLYPRGCYTPKLDPNAVCDKTTEQKIDEGTCDKTPPKMPMMKM